MGAAASAARSCWWPAQLRPPHHFSGPLHSRTQQLAVACPGQARPGQHASSSPAGPGRLLLVIIIVVRHHGGGSHLAGLVGQRGGGGARAHRLAEHLVEHLVQQHHLRPGGQGRAAMSCYALRTSPTAAAAEAVTAELTWHMPTCYHARSRAARADDAGRAASRSVPCVQGSHMPAQLVPPTLPLSRS
jgi:hypothetical protein